MRFQKIETQIWRDEKFLSLTPLHQRFFFYVLTNPHSNMTGIYVLKPGYATEDLGCRAQDFQSGIKILEAAGMIFYDRPTSTMLIKNHLLYNPITNPNQKKAAVKHLMALPHSPLITKFQELNPALIKELLEVLHKGFDGAPTEELFKARLEVLPEVLRYTEEEEEEGEGEGEGEGAPAPAASPPPPPSGKKGKITKTTIPENFTISDQVRAWAKENKFTHLKEHLEAFKLKAQAGAYQKVDWDAFFKVAISENWAKVDNSAPEKGGYVPPDPNCLYCKGDGFEDCMVESANGPYKAMKDCRCRKPGYEPNNQAKSATLPADA